MRILSYIILLMFGLIFSQKQITNPCSDSLFIELKTVDIDLMSKNQLEYYISKSSDCAIYNNNVGLLDSLRMINSESLDEYKYYKRIGFSLWSIMWFLIFHNNISH